MSSSSAPASRLNETQMNSVYHAVTQAEHAATVTSLDENLLCKGEDLCSLHVVYEPRGTTRADRNLHLVCPVREDEDVSEKLLDHDWTVILFDRPTHKTNATVQSRLTIESRVIHGDPFQFLSKLGYKYSYEFMLKGSRWTQTPLVVEVYQVFRVAHQFQLKSATLLDPSGSWVLEARIRVANPADQVAMQRSMERLQDFKPVSYVI